MYTNINLSETTSDGINESLLYYGLCLWPCEEEPLCNEIYILYFFAIFHTPTCIQNIYNQSHKLTYLFAAISS